MNSIFEEKTEELDEQEKTHKEVEKVEEWETDLETEDILKRKNTTRAYETACKVLGIVPVKYFADRLTSTEIVMKHHGLGAKGAQAIANVMDTNNTITKLDLTNNSIESGGADIGRSLQINRTLAYLNLSENKLGMEAGKEIAEMLTYNGSLKILLLSGNDFGDTEAVHFANGLRQNSSLQVLDLHSNNIGDLGSIALGGGLSGNDTLKEINIGWNKIRMKGVSGFVAAMRGNSVITNVNLEATGIGEAGGAISGLLQQNSNLKVLNISHCRLNDTSLQQIAKSLESHSGIQEFYCSHNPVTDVGALALFKAAASSNSLKVIGIQSIKLTRDGRLKLAELKQDKESLIIKESDQFTSKIDKMVKEMKETKAKEIALAAAIAKKEAEEAVALAKKEAEEAASAAAAAAETETMGSKASSTLSVR